jgi:NADH-dependent peroxiredoxin subunit F
MLDPSVQTQLESVFASLESDCRVTVEAAGHPARDELLELLNDTASASDRIEVVENDAPGLRFGLERDGRPLPISVRGIPGEKENIGRGVAFCPHCDGSFYKNKPVIVVGGGNSGVEAAIDLAGICSHVTLLEFSDQLKADNVLIEKLRSLSNADIRLNAAASRVLDNGDKVCGIEYEDRTSGKTETVQADGIFVQIGLIPNSAPFADLVELNEHGEIIVDAHCRTGVPGVYAAGDLTDVPFKQIIIAMGEGAKAGLSVFEEFARGTIQALS